MDINLTLTAIKWRLVTDIERSALAGGVLVVKNAVERTYLTVTPEQWQLLRRFAEPRMVPQVLEAIIQERACPALGEFYELILKAVRHRILISDDHVVRAERSHPWAAAMEPARWRASLWALLICGMISAMVFDAALPASLADWGMSLIMTLGAAGLGTIAATTLLVGSGRELYVERGFLMRSMDAAMLPPPVQRTVAVAPLAMMALAAGAVGWTRPQWSLLPLLTAVVMLRPFLGGRVSGIIRVGAKRRWSDAEKGFIFPPNRTPAARWLQFCRLVRRRALWKEVGYGMVWAAMVGYFLGRMAGVPLLTLGFWQHHGLAVAGTLAASPIVLGLAYTASVFWQFGRDQAQSLRRHILLWWRRWFGNPPDLTVENEPINAVRRCLLLRQLTEPTRQVLARQLVLERLGAKKMLADFGAPVTHLSLIVSGKVGVYRQAASGRLELMQVLCEDEIAGLHAIADPKFPDYAYRSLTPLTLLQLPWAEVETLVLNQVSPQTIANLVIKTPFLARMNLCRNWHLLAIRRFAELAVINNYEPDAVILFENMFSESFYIMLEGHARVTRRNRQLAMVRSGDFLGEIGLLQNSDTAAQVQAAGPARCLSIGRREFLRFVAHNYSVALELERVSSKRLGHPIFPLTPGNFRQF